MRGAEYPGRDGKMGRSTLRQPSFGKNRRPSATMSSSPRSVILIPAWNEGALIGAVVEQAVQYYPVLVVDDGSTDDTPVVAKRAGAQVIRHEGNRGKGLALMTGFRWALEQGTREVITLDADGQHDPAEIPNFIAIQRDSDAELVIGRRDFSKMPFPRGYTNAFGSWLLSRVLGERIHDNQSGYRLHRRELLEVFRPTAARFELEVEIIAQALFHGMKIAWVPIATIYDTGKVSHFHPIRDSLLFFSMVWRARSWRKKGPDEQKRSESPS